MADMGGFDAKSTPENPGFEPIPAGEYDAIITASEGYTTSSGKFLALKFTLQILNGPCQNRTLFDRLNFKRSPSYQGPWTDKDDKACQIGAGQLSSLCRAVDVLTPRDSSELHHKPLRIKVKVRGKDTDEYGIQNEVSAYKPRQVSAVVPGGNSTIPPMETSVAGKYDPPSPF